MVFNVFKFELLNGLLMDIGVYCIYLVVVLFGKLKDVIVIGYKLLFGVDGEGMVILLYDGFEVVLMYLKILNLFVLVEIQGEDGIIVLDSIYGLEWVEICYCDGCMEDIFVFDLKLLMYYEMVEFINFF